MPTSQAAAIAIAEAIKSSLKSDLLRTASLSREYCDGIWAIDEEIRRKLLNILEQYKIERKRDVSAVCAEVLEINKELLTDTDIEINVTQLIQLVKYNVNAKEFDSSLERQYRKNSKLFKQLLLPSINTIWYIITGCNNLPDYLCKVLVGLGTGQHQLDLKIAIKQVDQLFTLLYRYHKYLRSYFHEVDYSHRHRRRLISKGQNFKKPSFRNAEEFLKEADKAIGVKTDVLNNIMKNSNINFNDNNFDWKSWVNDKVKDLHHEMEGDSKEGDGSVVAYEAELKAKKLEYEEGLANLVGEVELSHGTTFDALIDELDRGNIGLDEYGQVIMDTRRWNILRNSPIVSYMLFDKLMRKFYPGGKPVTLDVLAGVTEEDDQTLIGKGPQINLYLEEHEAHGQILCVVVLQDHLSKNYFEIQRRSLNGDETAFYNYKNNSFVRVMSEEPTEGDLPYMEFGASDTTYTLYEADKATSVETDVIRMTNYLFAILDEVLRDAIDIVQSILLGRCDPCDAPKQVFNYASILMLTDEERNRINENLLLQESRDNEQHRVVVSVNHHPCDSVDGGHINAGNSGYTSHNDADNKFGNCSNDKQYSHQDSMRIHTMGLQFNPPSSESPSSETTSPGDNLTLMHGYENMEECFSLTGHFYNHDKVMKFDKPKKNSKINFGGMCHSHIQPPGSQVNGLEHLVSRKLGQGQDSFCRVFYSLRTFLPYRDKLQDHIDNLSTEVSTNTCAYGQSNYNIIDLCFDQKRDTGQGCTSNSMTMPPKHNRKPIKRKRDDKKSAKKNNEKILKLETDLFPNGDCTDNCIPRREAVISMPNPSTYIDEVSQHITVARCAYDNNSTFKVKMKSGKVTNVGPRVFEDSETGEWCLCQPWKYCEDAYKNDGVTKTQFLKHIIKPDNPDTLILHSLSKNTSSLLENLLILQSNGTTEDHVLKPMTIRGTGGALNNAGSNGKSITKENKSDATCELSTHGKPSCKQCAALQLNCLKQRYMDVFFRDHYIGGFYVKKVTTQRYSIQDAKEELDKFSQLLEKLHNKDPNLFPKEVTPGMKNELTAMRAVSFWYELEPVFPDLHLYWQRQESDNPRPWDLLEMNAVNDFRVPHYECPAETLNDVVGIDAEFADLNSLLEISCSLGRYDFLTGEAVSRLGWESSEGAADLPAGLAFLEPSTRGKMTWEAIVGAMIHSAGATVLKATVKELMKKTEAGLTLSTCTKVLSKLVGISEFDLIEEHNLMNSISKPVHPYSLDHEVTSYLCQVATESFKEGLSKLNSHGKFANRYGGAYFCSDTGMKRAAQSIIITITNSSHLLTLLDLSNSNLTDLYPGSEAWNAFVANVKRLQWPNNTFVHKLFRGTINTQKSYVTFIESLADNINKVKHFMETKSKKNKINYETDRNRCLTEIIGIFFSITPFQAQVIMRSIEMCMHEPFGEVNHIVGGSGSKDCAKLLGKDMNKKNSDVHSIASDLLSYLNEREWERYELDILGLVWNPRLRCLQHRYGIGKKLDLSDVEHTLCMVYKMYKNVGASRNTSLKMRFANERYFPIKLKGDKIAIDQDFMQYLKDTQDRVIKAYTILLQKHNCKHSKLHEIFRINFAKLYPHGTQVSKEFEDPNDGNKKLFSGVIKSYDKESALYKVEYDDGDSEELNGKEVSEILVKGVVDDDSSSDEDVIVAKKKSRTSSKRSNDDDMDEDGKRMAQSKKKLSKRKVSSKTAKSKTASDGGSGKRMPKSQEQLPKRPRPSYR